MKPFVEVQFTGNAKLYGYLIPANHEVTCSPGVRVIVISKVKEDGTPSLSIATIVNVGECSDEQATQLKPFVHVVNPLALKTAVAAYAVEGATNG